MEDPTKMNMINHLIDSTWVTDAIDVECAIYWFAANHHSGQGSHLYSVLSTSSYKPGASECGPEKGSTAESFYNLLKKEYAS